VLSCRSRKKGPEKKNNDLQFQFEGQSINHKKNMSIEINATAKGCSKCSNGLFRWELAADGVVTGLCQCAYTGGPHPVKSLRVKAQM
jgi:hypothetical protein